MNINLVAICNSALEHLTDLEKPEVNLPCLVTINMSFIKLLKDLFSLLLVASLRGPLPSSRSFYTLAERD